MTPLLTVENSFLGPSQILFLKTKTMIRPNSNQTCCFCCLAPFPKEEVKERNQKNLHQIFIHIFSHLPGAGASRSASTHPSSSQCRFSQTPLFTRTASNFPVRHCRKETPTSCRRQVCWCQYHFPPGAALLFFVAPLCLVRLAPKLDSLWCPAS